MKHGHTKLGQITVEYRAWCAMKRRCYAKKSEKYKIYRAKGIRVCERWLNSFENFISDMGFKPSPKHSLERKDGSKGYSPENCKWATIIEQNNNRNICVRIELNGRTQTLSQWATELGIKPNTVLFRINAGWTPEKALMTPILIQATAVTFNGVTKSEREWSKLMGGNKNLVRDRLKIGWSAERAITTPHKPRR